MPDEQKAPVRKLEGAESYYVKDPVTGAWGYFTIVTSIGLLQIFCDFGTFTDNFADRWSSPGPDFKAFLTTDDTGYFANAIETTATQYDDRAGWRKSVERRVGKVMIHLWPLFIEQLKAELVADTPTEPAADDRPWHPIERVAVTVDVDGTSSTAALSKFTDGGRKVWANLEDRAAAIARVAAGQLKEMAPDLPYSAPDTEAEEAED